MKKKTKTIKVSRWVNVYKKPINGINQTYKSIEEAAHASAFNNYILIETIELKGSYEVEIPERSITITEGELRAAMSDLSLLATVRKEVLINDLFGGEL